MKHLIAALVLLLAIVGLTTANALTVVRHSLRLGVGQRVELRRFISLSTHLCEVERLDDAVSDLRAYLQCGSFANYYAARTRAAEAAYDLLAAEKFSLDNII